MEKEEATRWRGILKSYADMCVELGLIDTKDVCIDCRKLTHISQRANRDLKRLADSHPGISKADSHKIAGFYTYWICRVKPVYILSNNVHNILGLEALSLNEYLAVYFSLGYINSVNEIKVTKKKTSGEKITKFDLRCIDIVQMTKSIYDFIYNLSHCNVSGESLAMQYYYIDITAGNEAYLREVLGDVDPLGAPASEDIAYPNTNNNAYMQENLDIFRKSN